MKRLWALSAVVLLWAGCSEPATKQVASCTSSADCGAGQTCNITNADTNTGECVVVAGNNGGSSCILDGDCDAGTVCESQACVTTCADDGECASGRCAARALDPTVRVCRDECGADQIRAVVNGLEGCFDACNAGSCDAGFRCEQGTICIEITGGNNGNNGVNNGVNNGLNNGGSGIYLVLIESVTTDLEACENSTAGGDPDPGPDLMEIELEDSSGAILGFAATVDYDTGLLENGYPNAGIFDGNANDPAQFCSEGGFTVDKVYSMGCDGAYLVVEFIGSDGAPIALSSDQQVNVQEYGEQCFNGSAKDEFDLYVCADTAAVRNAFDRSSCVAFLGGGSGDVTVGLNLP